MGSGKSLWVVKCYIIAMLTSRVRGYSGSHCRGKWLQMCTCAVCAIHYSHNVNELMLPTELYMQVIPRNRSATVHCHCVHFSGPITRQVSLCRGKPTVLSLVVIPRKHVIHWL